MDLALAGKVGIVTGASRGIGAAIARTLAAEGMALLLVARSGERLDALASELPTACSAWPADLRDAQAPEAAVAAVLERHGRLDLVVNNAGATKRDDFFALTDVDWTDGFALKFYGAMRLCRAAWPHLRATQGAIVNIAGLGGRTGNADFTKALADRGVADGVRVNAINPGSIATERLHGRIERLAADHGTDPATAAARLAAGFRVARFGTPEEIARAVGFLASPAAAYCQGAILDVDGGQTRTL